MKPLADMHVHSTFSVDAKDDLVAMCQAAINRGLRHICFTEHVDYDPLDQGYGFFREEAFSRAVDVARRRFGDRLEILKGAEFSAPHRYPKEFARLAPKDFDLIAAGVHAIDSIYLGEERLVQQFSVDEIFERYYVEVLDAVRFGGFDLLVHLDLPKRYLGQTYFPQRLIDRVLEEMVESDIALEINTSPLRKGLDECAPDQRLVQRYVDLGGRKITFGSDAHSRAEIGAGFDRALELVSQVGAGQVGLFRQRHFVPLVDTPYPRR